MYDKAISGKLYLYIIMLRLLCNAAQEEATGEKGLATKLEPGTYILSQSFSHTSYQSQPQILRLPLLYVPVVSVPLYSDCVKTYASRLVQCDGDGLSG